MCINVGEGGGGGTEWGQDVIRVKHEKVVVI